MNSKLFTGTLDLLILDLLGRGDSYGFEISQMVLNRSGGRFELKEGSLYPALHRLERQKLIKGHWRQMNAGAATNPDNGNVGGRRRKYYSLTARGNKALETKRGEWDEFVHAVSGVLGANARRAIRRLTRLEATACRLCGRPCRTHMDARTAVAGAEAVAPSDDTRKHDPGAMHAVA